MKKFLAFFSAIAVLVISGLLVVYKYIIPPDYPVFLESYGEGVMTIDSENADGKDSKYLLNVKRGDTITVNINPKRTDSVYYNLEKLTVNGEDVTSKVNMLQYKTEVYGKLDIVAFFEKGKKPDAGVYDKKLKFQKTQITFPFDNEYLGSYNAYDFSSPSIIYDDKSGYYYAFGSDNQAVRSKDLQNWTDRTTYFLSPKGKSNENIMLFSQFPSVAKWAKAHGYNKDEAYSSSTNNRKPQSPDIVKIGDTYYLYFSLSKTADANESAIFCVRTTDLEYAVENKDWQDVGVVISSCGYNKGENKEKEKSSYYDDCYATAPCVFYDKEGGLFMAYGSYYGRENINGAIYLLELSTKTGLLKKESKYNGKGSTVSTQHSTERYKTGVLIAKPGSVPSLSKKDGSVISESEIIFSKETGYYYLFTTYGEKEGSYNIRVSRSKNVDGPYRDFNSEKMNEFSSSKKSNQYTKGLYLISGYNFVLSSGGGVSYTDTGRASTGCPSIIQTKDGKLIMALQSRAYYKANGEIVCGDEAAKKYEVSAYTKPTLEIRQIFLSDNQWVLSLPQSFADEEAVSDVKEKEFYGHWDMLIFKADGDKKNYKAIERTVSGAVSIFDSAVISERDIKKGNKLSKNSLKKEGDCSYSLIIDGVKYTVYPTILWDNELSEAAYGLSGIGEDGSVIWGKKNFSFFMGIYTDAYYYVHSLSDDLTQTMYDSQMRKISENPSQEKIDEMTAEMIEKILGN